MSLAGVIYTSALQSIAVVNYAIGRLRITALPAAMRYILKSESFDRRGQGEKLYCIIAGSAVFYEGTVLLNIYNYRDYKRYTAHSIYLKYGWVILSI